MSKERKARRGNGKNENRSANRNKLVGTGGGGGGVVETRDRLTSIIEVSMLLTGGK